MMNPDKRAAMSQALGAAPPAQMPPNAPPQGAPAGPPQGGAMTPEQAQQFLASKGITPDDMDMLVMAIDTVMNSGGGAPQGAPQGA